MKQDKTDQPGEMPEEMIDAASAYSKKLDLAYQEHAYQDFCEGWEAASVAIQALKEGKGMRWVKASDRAPDKRMNCFVMVFTPLQGGYNYKSTRLWDGKEWIDELNGQRERDKVIEWLDETQSDELEKVRAEAADYRKAIEDMNAQLDEFWNSGYSASVPNTFSKAISESQQRSGNIIAKYK